MKKASTRTKSGGKTRPQAASKSKSVGPAATTPPAAAFWNLRLYVAGQTPRSLLAFSNLKRLCEEFLAGRYQIEVIDLVKQPHLAQADQVLALPTLVRKLPPPIKRIVGDLSNFERMKIGMDLSPHSSGHD